jgi:hypothetical protein
MDALTKLVNRLQAIAKKNDDEFEYRVDILPKLDGSLHYELVVQEKADGHCFVSASSGSIENCASAAELVVKAACEDWGYEE